MQTFTRALAIAPNDAMLGRWRGHRNLSVREFDHAMADLMHGYRLDNLNYGILYHLGVLRFVRGDFNGAADAFARAQPRAPDAGELAGSTDWLWMSLQRAGRAREAIAMLARHPDSLATTISYASRLRLYRGSEIGPDALFSPSDTSDINVATLSYGLGNWYLVKGDTVRARAQFERSIKSGGWPAFGFIASEAELARLGSRGAGRTGALHIEKDVRYIQGRPEYANKKDRLDVYAPADAHGAPVIISVHGGALTEGDKSEQPYVGERFASAGNVTVVVNYRLSPGVSHPAHVQDLAAAVAWVKKNVARYGGDPNKIFLAGHSAGGYLITLLLLDPRYLAAQHLTPHDIRGAAPVSGFFYVEREGVAPDRPKEIWGADPSAWKAASPATYVRADVPPLLLLYADGDDAWRRQQQVDFAAALRGAGDPKVETHLIKGRTHLTVWYAMKDGEEETSRSIEQFVTAVLGK